MDVDIYLQLNRKYVFVFLHCLISSNTHGHLIVSRKDQSNKKKLSPLTNHKNTQKGAIKGGFDRTNLFRQTEKGFDRLFSYDRKLSESFEYYNTMKKKIKKKTKRGFRR